MKSELDRLARVLSRRRFVYLLGLSGSGFAWARLAPTAGVPPGTRLAAAEVPSPSPVPSPPPPTLVAPALAPAVASTFTGLRLLSERGCRFFPGVDDRTDAGGVRTISLTDENELLGRLTIKGDTQEFSTPTGLLDSVLVTRDVQQKPEEHTVILQLTGQESTFELQSVVVESAEGVFDVRLIRAFVNGRTVASLRPPDGLDGSEGSGRLRRSKKMRDAFARVRAALSDTTLPHNLVALNLFNGWAPLHPSSVAIGVLSAAGGVPPVVSPELHQAGLAGNGAALTPLQVEPSPSPVPSPTPPRPGVIGRWERCLEEACRECAGCWDDQGIFGHFGCHECPDTPALESFAQGTCYYIDAIGCVPAGVIGSLR